MDSYQPPDDRDIDNPYAPPQSSFKPEPVPELIAGMPFTVGDVYNRSWAIFKENMWLCISIFWGTVTINMAIGFGLGLLLQALAASVRDQTMFAIANILVQFTSFVIGFWLTIGQSRAFLKIVRGEPVAFDEIFQGGRFLLTTILAWVVFLVILALPILIAVFVITFSIVAMGNQPIGSVLVFLAVSIPTGLFVVYATARLVMYYYLIIDHRAGVIESLQQSWALCRNDIGTITLVLFAQTAILLAGLLACVVGLVFAMPLMTLLMPVTYVALTGTGSSRTTKPELFWEEDA